MQILLKLLGRGLLKKDHSANPPLNEGSKSDKLPNKKVSKNVKKKASVEIFIRKILGTHLIEKKF